MDVQVLGEELIYKGRKVTLKKLDLIVRGKKTFHEIVVFGKSVAILPFIDDKNVILVRQFRGPLKEWIVEIPAGRIEKDESPEEACTRELEEEIGYKPKFLEFLGGGYLTPGYSDEYIYLFVAKNLEHVGQHLEEHEVIKTIKMPYERLKDMVLNGEIEDIKTMMAVVLYEIKVGSKWRKK